MRRTRRNIGFAAVILAGLLASALACSEVRTHGRVIYSAAFETPRDTVGWGANGTLAVGPESPGSRRRALWISGGCVGPHAYHELPASPRDRRLVLRAVARNVRGGSLILGVDREHGAAVPVTGDQWRSYESPDTVLCPAGAIPFVEILAGGIVEGGLFVERIEVVRVQ